MEKVYIFDTTLRDGEQALNASLTVAQKLRIARQLERLKVDVIEAGFPISSPQDFESVRTISTEIKESVVCGLARTAEKDIDACADALKKAHNPRIHTFVGTSAIHAEKKLRKSEDEIVEMVTSCVSRARKKCAEVEFSPEDAGRSKIDFLVRTVEAAIDAGATIINIPDTVGYTVAGEFASIVSVLMERVQNMDKAILSVHCHNDLGMATANSLAAVKSGARQIECAMNGIGERAGNAALEEIVMSLKVRRKLFKVTTGIDTTQIMRTSRLVRDICNMPVQPNKAVVGSNAFAHSSGIHQDGVLKAKKTYEIMTPRSVGLKENRMNLTSRSGKHMVKSRLVQLGYDESEFDINSFYDRFITLADKKGTVYDDDLITLMEVEESDAFEEIYSLKYLDVSSGKDIIPTATVRVECSGACLQEAACGDGPVDAMTKAIDRVTGFDVGVESFSLDSITEGREALGKVRITGKVKEGVFNGFGSSTDIIEASAEAYMEVVNKIARLRKHRKQSPAPKKTRKKR